MSIPNEALQKLLQEIEQKAAQSQQQINVVKAQIASKNRDSRMVQLTLNEVDSLPDKTNVYEGVGKMFMMTETSDLKGKLTAQNTELKSDTSNLEKKLNYLETTYKNSREHIEQLFKAGQA
ncbi:Prefoldin [Viridothelium virens]|uniref:Prefoldin n=1 Tax=Viridothelium virens TaxID=1048519 RepID=A0A6A6H9W7_VIRVR|nr:Prefoldin [Viridothelium virens]